MFDKPVDRWLGLGSVAVAVALYLLPKTPLVVIVCLAVIFGVLVHPIWNFWWIEESPGRKIGALIILAGVLVVLGDLSWPSAPTPEHIKIEPTPDLVGKIHNVYVVTSGNYKATKEQREVLMPGSKLGKRPRNADKIMGEYLAKNVMLFITGTIENKGDMDSLATDWGVTYRNANGLTIEGRMIQPSVPGARWDQQTIYIALGPGAADVVSLAMIDYWPRKMDMNSIKAHGPSLGWLQFALPGISKEEYFQTTYSLTLRFRDSKGKESTVIYPKPPSS